MDEKYLMALVVGLRAVENALAGKPNPLGVALADLANDLKDHQDHKEEGNEPVGSKI